MALADLLAERGLLGGGRRRDGTRPGWSEIGRDLARLGGIGNRLPPPPVAAESLRATCLTRFRTAAPSADSTALRAFARPPTLGDAIILLADLAARAAAPLPREDARR
jgi:hypothetical protein